MDWYPLCKLWSWFVCLLIWRSLSCLMLWVMSNALGKATQLVSLIAIINVNYTYQSLRRVGFDDWNLCWAPWIFFIQVKKNDLGMSWESWKNPIFQTWKSREMYWTFCHSRGIGDIWDKVGVSYCIVYGFMQVSPIKQCGNREWRVKTNFVQSRFVVREVSIRFRPPNPSTRPQ